MIVVLKSSRLDRRIRDEEHSHLLVIAASYRFDHLVIQVALAVLHCRIAMHESLDVVARPLHDAVQSANEDHAGAGNHPRPVPAYRLLSLTSRISSVARLVYDAASHMGLPLMALMVLPAISKAPQTKQKLPWKQETWQGGCAWSAHVIRDRSSLLSIQSAALDSSSFNHSILQVKDITVTDLAEHALRLCSSRQTGRSEQ